MNNKDDRCFRFFILTERNYDDQTYMTKDIISWSDEDLLELKELVEEELESR